MKFNHVLLIILVTALWGVNFVFIRLGLNDLPPLLLCTLRFFLVAFPAVFFVPRPQIKPSLLLTYGFVMFGLQFAFLFTAIRAGMSPGLASLVMQCQVFFTLGLASYIFKDKVSFIKIIGALVSFSGLGIVALHTQGDITVIGLILTLMASFSWASGNVLSKKVGAVPAFGLVVWGSLAAVPFLLFMSLVFEGPILISTSIQHMGWVSILSVAYIAYMSTHLAYSLWSHFLKVYPITKIAPFTLLVPIFGFLSSAVILHESFPAWKVAASVLLVLGLFVYFLDQRLNFRKLITRTVR